MLNDDTGNNNNRTHAIQKMATIEQRIKTDSKLNIFDRSLIIADLFNSDKKNALDELLNIRREMIK